MRFYAFEVADGGPSDSEDDTIRFETDRDRPVARASADPVGGGRPGVVALGGVVSVAVPSVAPGNPDVIGRTLTGLVASEND